MLLSLALSLFLTQTTPALQGLDPVELILGDKVPGQEQFQAQWGRHTYYFGSASTRDAFLDDPERWGIQWGGACARMGPLSGRGDANRFSLYDSKIYIFASDSCRSTFQKAPERFVAKVAMDFPRGKAAVEQGRLWVERAARAHGAAVFDAKKGLRLKRRTEEGGWQREEELVLRSEGGIWRRSRWTPPEGQEGASDTTWVVGRQSFTVEDGTVHDLLSTGERDAVRRFAHRQPLYLFWARNQPGFRAAQYPREPGDKHVRVAVEHAGLMTELHLDPETAEVRGLYWLGRLGSGALQDIEETFTDTADLGGAKIPLGRKLVRDLDETKPENSVFDSAELLDELPAGLYARPQ